MPTEHQPKVAVIHDWLNTYRGGERVLEAILEIFPSAEIFTLFYEKGRTSKTIESRPIHTSFLNYFPLKRTYYRHFLPLFPAAIERFDLSGFDLVVSSNSCVAKGVITPPQTPHLCYCHTAMRYIWDQYAQYFSGITEKLVYPFAHYLRLWDVTSSARVDHFLANSVFVADRIRKYYRREAGVVAPFVDLEKFSIGEAKRDDFFLVVSAFAPYKRIDLAIEACRRTHKKLIIVGEGQAENHLRALAGPQTEFVGRASDEEVRGLLQRTQALLFPGEEDFGITPLEAMACGTPVIAYGSGGVLDTVIDGETGLFFHQQSVEALENAIISFRSGDFSPVKCRERAELFSKESFKAGFIKELESCLGPKATKRVVDTGQRPLR